MSKVECPICGGEMRVITSYVEVADEPQYACVCLNCEHVDYIGCNEYEKSEKTSNNREI